jgi:2-polyprenyl-3-methyl-5-hydroxy-6-metoxy-1,4-benzoquinol methylase
MVKSVDIEGHNTLSIVLKADKLNEWMYDTIKPYCKGKILEIGSGIGTISSFFIRSNSDITLSDLRSNYCEILRNKFSKDVLEIDLADPDFDVKYYFLLGKFDTIFSLNVVEHIENDVQAIANCKKLLKDKGVLIILVPAYQWLFCDLDRELEHFRRYTKKKIELLFVENKMKITKTFYFNLAGIFAWFFSGKILRNKNIPEGQMGLFNFLVPVFKVADKMILQKVGLSVISVVSK